MVWRNLGKITAALPLISLLTCFGGIPFMPTGLEPGELGGRVTLEQSLNVSALKGHHVVIGVRATLEPDSSPTVECAWESLSDAPWDGVIVREYTLVNGVPVDTDRSDINLRLAVTLPDDQTLDGERATLRLTGKVSYPTAGVLEDSFEESTADFDIEQVLRLTADPVESSSIGESIGTVMIVLASLMFWAFIGCGIALIVRTVKQSKAPQAQPR